MTRPREAVADAAASPIWTCARAPHSYDGDATDAVLDQVERFAPGFRDRVAAVHVTTSADFEAHSGPLRHLQNQ